MSFGLVQAQNNPFSASTPAQNGYHRCYTEEMAHQMYNTDPAYRQAVDQAHTAWVNHASSSASSARFADSVIRIPVVMHIIHNSGNENISKAQIESQIRILNEDYRKIANTNGDGQGVDTRYEFFLAQKDPNGNCTDGIERIQSTLTQHSTTDAAQLKALSQWDPTRYLNFWVVDDIAGGVLGYATFPTALSTNPALDGIVCADDFVGDMGTAGTGQYGFGRTATHEVGHWLGLYHTFQGGCGNNCATTGDEVCDTPPVDAPNFGCPTGHSSCGDLDQIDNYMDYTDDLCMSRFTQGQTDRMDFFTTTFRPVHTDSMNAIDAGLYGCLGINYCVSEATNTSGTEIRNVSLNNFTNSSNNDCTGYSDNSTTFIDVTLDSTYTLSVTTGHCTNGTAPNHEVKAYIDWNRDGDFDDAGEDYAVKALGASGTGTVSITVPSTTPIDKTGLRIVCTDGGVIGPCGTYGFGETEDYGLNIVAPPPTISSFSPTSGPIATFVTIVGEHFNNATDVKFNNTSAAIYSVVSGDTIEAFVPTGATTGNITVTTPQGTDISVGLFTVTTPMPAITNFTPSSGPIGTQVDIFGANFGSVTGVQFNGQAALTVNQISSTLVRAIVPAGATTGPITVNNTVGTAVSTNDYTVTLPSPTATLAGGGNLCEGGNGTLTFNLTGTGPYSVVYTDGTNNFTVNNINSSTHNETVTPAVGTITYSIVSITDANFTITAPDPGITGTAVYTVFDRPSSAAISGTGTICDGDSVQITFNAVDGTGPFDIEIDNGIGTIDDVPNNSTFMIAPSNTATYSLIDVSDNNGCSTTNFTGSASYTVDPAPTADFSRNVNFGIVTFTDNSSGATSWSWDFGDGTSGTNQNPVHVYSAVGIYTATQTVTNSAGCSDESSSNIIIIQVSSLSDLKAGETLNIYPNPAPDYVIVDLGLEDNLAIQLEIVSTNGSKVITQESNSSKEHNVQVDVSGLSEGVYFLNIQLSDGRSLRSKLFIE